MMHPLLLSPWCADLLHRGPGSLDEAEEAFGVPSSGGIASSDQPKRGTPNDLELRRGDFAAAPSRPRCNGGSSTAQISLAGSNHTAAWTRLVFCAALLLLLVGASCRSSVRHREMRAGRLGTVRLIGPVGTPHALVFLFSDSGGWDSAYEQAADALADLGAVVIGVDLPQYLAGLAASEDGCHYVVAELEDMSERLQRELGFQLIFHRCWWAMVKAEPWLTEPLHRPRLQPSVLP